MGGKETKGLASTGVFFVSKSYSQDGYHYDVFNYIYVVSFVAGFLIFLQYK